MYKTFLFQIVLLLAFQIGNSQILSNKNDISIKGEYANILPLKRLDTLKINLVSDDNMVRNMLSKYIDIEKDLNKANLIIFTNSYDFERYIIDNDVLSNRKIILINSKNTDYTGNPDIIINIEKSGNNKFAIQTIFGGAVNIKSNGNNRLSYGNAKDVGLDYNYMKTKIDSIANTAIKKGVAPGIQVLVARHGVIVLHETYGFHTYDSITKVEKNNIYDWASITKITSALPAIMKLHDEVKFDLDATLGTYVPYFDKGNKKELIFRRMLSHNSGLYPWIPFWKTTLRKSGNYKWRTLSNKKGKRYKTEIAPGLYIHDKYKKKIYKQIKKSEINEDEHPSYKYSGLLFYLLPEIVANISKQKYQKYLNNNFYNKLGATTVGYNPLNRFDKSRIIPTENDTIFRHTLLHGTVHDEGATMMEGVSANAGLFGSTLDLAKIMQMYLWKGKYGGERYISENTMNKFTFAHYANEGNKRGLGFDKPKLENRENDSCSLLASMESFGHGGYTGTYTWVDPESGLLFVFMSNRVYPTRENRKIYKFNVRPSMHKAIYEAIIN